MTCYNLVCDSAFVLVAWRRVRGNKGARTAGVDGQTARYIERERGEEAFLADVRAELKARTFAPLPVQERQTPKPGGRLRRLGIATIQDRVVQAALKLVLEPIFEADIFPTGEIRALAVLVGFAVLGPRRWGGQVRWSLDRLRARLWACPVEHPPQAPLSFAGA
jgi:hypothetical protein